MYKIKLFVIFLILLYGKCAYSQTQRSIVDASIKNLTLSMKKAKLKKIDVKREELVKNTALLFLDYADYDEKHYERNVEICKKSPVYKNYAETIALKLPEWERSECLKMVNDANDNLQKVIKGEIIRKKVPKIEWKKIKVSGPRLINSDGTPVYIADYNFMEKGDRYKKYYGDFGGYYYDFGFLGPDLNLSDSKQKELNESSFNSSIGSPFLGHGSPAKWMIEKYPDITKGARLFTKYDIDNPYIRKYWDVILKQIVPKLKGKECTKLGYLLANEPHWNTAAKSWETPIDKIDNATANWATGEVSNYTISKFRKWLKINYTSILNLNKHWGRTYKSFNDVRITIPLDNHMLGKAIWYDWMKFNQVRVNDWFQFLKNTIQKYDSTSYVNVKVMPSLWADNSRDSGLDFETICNLSGVIGNDASANLKRAWGNPGAWEKNYSFNWREMFMGYDFFRSVSPNKPNYNSEVHYLMSTGFQKLDLSTEYTRCLFWLSTILGCDANTIWVWSRKDDGNGNFDVNINQCGESHFGSVCTQPRVLNEIHQTFMDLNANSSDIDLLQNMEQPIRIFYSETSALNKRKYMDQIFELYEKINFNGIPIGFVTSNILNTQDNKLWDIVLVKDTEYLLPNELKSLQDYINRGGTIIIDNVSATRNQYMEPYPLNSLLTESKGKIIKAETLNDYKNIALNKIKQSHKPPLQVIINNASENNHCFWRSIRTNGNRIILSLVNIGNEDANINITNSNVTNTGRDLLTGKLLSDTLIIKPEQIVFCEFE